MLAWCIGRLARHADYPVAGLTTTPGRLHDREDDLQAAADKLGRLLFSLHVRLTVRARPQDEAIAARKLREMAGTFGQFAAPRMASFHATKPRAVHT